jgi:threonine synthase
MKGEKMDKPKCKKYPAEDILPDEQGNCSLCGATLNSSGGEESLQEIIDEWIKDNKSLLLKEYRDYLTDQLVTKSDENLQYIEDWKRWSEVEWVRANIPF